VCPAPQKHDKSEFFGHLWPLKGSWLTEKMRFWQLSLFYGTYAVKLAGSSGLVETSWVQPSGGCPAVDRRGSEWFSG